MTLAVRYPAGPITPAGSHYFMKNRLPTVAYESPDKTALFNLLGGPAIPDRTMPECVTITDLKGLIPPWQNIKQKGATQDGSTYVTSLYDECEVDIGIRIQARNPSYARQVIRDWTNSWDAKQPGQLSFTDQTQGIWRSSVRWAKAPVDRFSGGLCTLPTQKFTWTSIAYDAFWRGDPSVDQMVWNDPAAKPLAGGGQYKFLDRVNVGDQPMFETYTCVGPGLFGFADGPGSGNAVFFGPILAGQIMAIRTDPRKRGVIDLSSAPPSPQAYTQFQQVLIAFLDFATGNNNLPLVQAIESLFGILPPQGNVYSLLNGRFSDNAAIPPRPSAGPATPYKVAVSIQGGADSSMIVASGTPLRRFPY